ncbi:NUDIX domain-containing protein [Gracilinema caldarium]|uniref:NUDIX domain-containing protein n=1 Tax=Gracilinema caldarium TaxID=215591 RepID=UPI0026E9F0D9|nr:NUDIX domain-containing protein [Gracilinema caldarium]
MFILSDPLLDMRFSDYGIQIPIRDQRAQAVLEHISRVWAGPSSCVFNLRAAADLLGIPDEDRGIHREDLERVHDKSFVEALFSEKLDAELIKTYELIDERGQPRRYRPDLAVRPLSALFETILNQVWGTYLACRLALELSSSACQGPTNAGPGFAYFLGGGMHHARRDSGSGFCLVNDIMIAVKRLMAEGKVSSVWIIDLDAHKGDGTAELAAGNSSIRTLSIHMASGWPLDEESLTHAVAGRAPLVPSDVEIPIPRSGEASYVPLLRSGLAELEALSQGRKPDLAIVVDGADPYEKDELPSTADLKLSLKTCVERDRLVYDFLRERHITSAWLMAGGYGERAWEPPAHFLASLVRPVAAAILEQDGKVLIARRAPGQKQAGLWEFPGGKLEAGETPEQCLEREITEELGVKIKVGPFFAENLYSYRSGTIRLMAYRARVLGGQLRLAVHSEVRWVSPLELLQHELSPADVKIARLLAGEPL